MAFRICTGFWRILAVHKLSKKERKGKIDENYYDSICFGSWLHS
jgi:hypothetical protein